MSAYDLLQAQAFLPIDAAEESIYIIKNFPEILKENPKGIYIVGKVDAVMTNGNAYFTKEGLELNVPITDMERITENVFNAQGQLVVPGFIMRSKRKYLRNESTYSYFGIKAVFYYIQRIIESHSAHTTSRRYHDLFLNCFKPEYREKIFNQDIDIDYYLNRLHDKIMSFIEKDPWIIFLVKQLGSVCLVEKTIDYRIFDWTLNREREREETQTLSDESKCARTIEIVKYF